ncbi:MAG: sigma-70 family RNA polymerase sigma factor [Chloroflexia bacterium]|jgi:RNA polymerase sigma factor (sigma-70 family)|nr:sigma-70 family RNA polymerase sigma factor [Chloroflexia bacterium]
MSAAPGPDGHSRTKQSQTPDDRAAQAAEQVRELRERPHALVKNLRSYVGFELSRRVTMGQLTAEDVLRDEVVDTAFASALTRLQEGEPIRDLHTYLRSRAQDMIRREIRRVGNERVRVVSLDTVLTGEDGEDGEVVRLADIIPDSQTPDLDQAAIDGETVTYLIEALSDLPERWRTIVLQRTVEGRSAREIAEEQELDIDEVRRIIVSSRDFLRDRMENVYHALDADDF